MVLPLLVKVAYEIPASREPVSSAPSFADPIRANPTKNDLESPGVPGFIANAESVDMLWHLSHAMGWSKVQVGNFVTSRAIVE